MIRKYRFGTPFETDAVVQKLPEEAGGLRLVKQYKYGKILVSRYEREGTP